MTAATTDPSPLPPTDRVRLGISACLLGEKVRYDGRDKAGAMPLDDLGGAVRWVPVCPEFDIGLGVPREPIHLVTVDGTVHLRGVDSGDDHTRVMRGHAEDRVRGLAEEGLDGYVLKARSPSCGLEVPVHDADGVVIGHDRGRFADVLVTRMRDLPVVEETDLADPGQRSCFLERVLVRHRWRRLRSRSPTTAALVAFHTAHKMSLLAHDEAIYRQLGPIVARAGEGEPSAFGAVLDRYGRGLAAAMARPATHGSHVNVLEHLLGMLRDTVSPEVRAALTDTVSAFRAGRLPFDDARRALLDAARRTEPDGWVARQTYLAADPERQLRALAGSGTTAAS